MPNSPRVVLPLLAAGFLSACSPSTESGSTAEAPTAAPPAAARRSRRDAAARDVEWRFYGGNLASQRYSPLDQIDASNAGQLKIAWRFNTGNYGPRPEARNETTPLMIDGVLYTQAGTTRNVVAIDPKSGELLWHWRPNDGEQRYRARAAQDLWPRPRVLDRRRRQRALVHGDAGVLPRGARSRHRPTGAGLRRERHRRSHGRRARRGQRQVEHRQQLAADDRRRRRHRRSRARGRHAAAVEGEFEGRRARLRRPYRQAAVDVPHDSRTAASRATRRGSTARPKWSATPAFGLR